VRIFPPELAARYFDWVDNMHDWCISRQLWWGHRIPVWYGPGGEVVCVGPGEEPPAGEGWAQDPDVLDTWFSSGLWPFSTLGWPDDTPDLRTFYPNTVLVTGYDILFFWVARMMLFGLYANAGLGPEQSVPFRQIALHGLVRDQFGKKMSKSRGNTVDPLDWIDRFGADATRFTLARGANPGSDIAVSEDWAAGARNFCNKLWNAVRFALINGAVTGAGLPAPDQLTAADRWIGSRLAAVTAQVDEYFAQYEFAKACEALYHFAWDEFCDWYLELAKASLAASGEAAQATRMVLGVTLDRLLRLLHPFLPFVTDELWTALTGGESVVIAAWPMADTSRADPAAEAEIAAVQAVVTEVRRFRSDQGVKPSQRVPARVTGAGGGETAIRHLLRLQEPGRSFTTTASLTTVGGVRVELDLSGTIDIAAESARLGKDLAAAQKELATNTAKLANPAFTGKAPEAVIAKVRARVATAQSEIVRIRAALDGLAARPPA
jgi:valyl-tRNA synthetase